MDDLSKAKIVVVVSFFVAVALFIKLCIQQKKDREKISLSKSHIIRQTVADR